MHCWADLKLVRGFRCYDDTHICKLIGLYIANTYSAEREMSATACTRSTAGCVHVSVLLCLQTG